MGTQKRSSLRDLNIIAKAKISMARLHGPFCSYGTIRKEESILRPLLGEE